MSDALSIPDLRQALADVEHIKAQVADLLRRQDAAEAALGLRVPDPDRAMSIRDVAPQIGKKPATLEKWLKTARKFDQYQLGLLFQKDATGHWLSSPRRIARWKSVVYRTLRAEIGVRRSA